MISPFVTEYRSHRGFRTWHTSAVSDRSVSSRISIFLNLYLDNTNSFVLRNVPAVCLFSCRRENGIMRISNTKAPHSVTRKMHCIILTNTHQRLRVHTRCQGHRLSVCAYVRTAMTFKYHATQCLIRVLQPIVRRRSKLTPVHCRIPGFLQFFLS